MVFQEVDWLVVKGEAGGKEAKWETLTIVQIGVKDSLTRGMVAAGTGVGKECWGIS